MTDGMECQEARPLLLDYQRGQLTPARHDEVRAHLERCARCAHEEAAEGALTNLVERNLPQYPAPLALKRRLAAHWPAPGVARHSWWRGWRRALAPAVAVAAVLIAGVALLDVERAIWRPSDAPGALVTEAVNDHLRLLQSEHPLEIQSGGIHQVKPWFAGRLDFAPIVGFEGDADFPLRGGAVGYFLDRKAAVFVYSRRLHSVSLFVFRADGLPWPTRGLQRIGGVDASVKVARGFSVILWRSGELGYALVSDLGSRELVELASKF